MSKAESGAECIIEERQGRVRSWSEMSGFVTSLEPGGDKILEGYFRAQKHLAEGERTKARELFDHLTKIPGYEKFEEENKELLRTIDLAVKGETRWE